MRNLSTSSRECTVTGMDSHELQGLDVVQGAASVETNHGIVNLIMNEYACYGKGHTIHFFGQIEWSENLVDNRSVQVGGKQTICTIDGYAILLIPSTTPGAEPPRDARDSGSARSHSTHLETSSSNRP